MPLRGPAEVSRGPGPTGVKDQVVGLYAKRLAATGFVRLAFDHRGFGAATDLRIRAVVGVAGAYNSPSWFGEPLSEASRPARRSMLLSTRVPPPLSSERVAA